MPYKQHYGRAKKFNEINIGDKDSFSVVITEKMHRDFAKLFKDYSPIHSSDKFCLKTRFTKKIGYAFMLTGLLSRFYGRYLPGGSSICVKQEAMFIKPFFINDKIYVYGEVINKSESTKLIEIKIEMLRNAKERIFKGNGIVQALF